MKNYLSIDIGGTEIKFAKLDSAGNIICLLYTSDAADD